MNKTLAKLQLLAMLKIHFSKQYKNFDIVLNICFQLTIHVKF